MVTTSAQRRPLEHQRRGVVGRPPGREALLGHQPPVERAALVLAVVVRARAAGQEAEAVAQPGQPREVERVGRRGLEPAVHPRARPAQHDALLPRLAQDDVEPVRPPDRQQARRVAAADVDDVLREHERAQVGDGALEQPEVRRLAVVVGREHAEEVRDVLRRVAARGSDEADPRPLAPCQREHERIQPRVVVLGAQLRPAHRDDAAAHALVNTASGSSALTIHSPASTISEILRSTHSEHSR